MILMNWEEITGVQIWLPLIFLLLHRYLSAQLKSVFHCMGLIALVPKEVRDAFNHVIQVTLTESVRR
jgi:hypothetical protein